LPLQIFITITAVIGAIIVLRISLWEKYRETSKSDTVCNSGELWLYAAIVIDISTIIVSLFQTASLPTTDKVVTGVPLYLFGLIILMTIFEILSVTISIITKVYTSKHSSISWLSFLDESKTADGKSYKVASRCGKLYISLELIFIIIAVIVTVILGIR